MFDIKQLLASPGINRLLQPLLMGGGQGIQPSNMLAGAGQMQAPVPPMPVQAPAAQMQPQQQKPGLMDRYNAFTESDRGRTLNDFFLGLAMGSNPNQSLAGAAQMVATGRAERAGKKNQNQTVEWLTKQGMSPEEAQMVASQPNVLSEFLKQRMKGGQESEYQQRAAAAQQYGLDPNTPEFQHYILTGNMMDNRDQDPRYKNEMELRKEYDMLPEVKDYKTVRSNYERIQKGVELGTGAGDAAIVFGYMKMLDPTSVVREGEQATTRNAAGVPEAIRGMYNQLIGGGQLSAEARTQILSAAERVYGESAANIEDLNKRYTGIAGAWNIDPTRVFTVPEQYKTNVGGQGAALPLPPSENSRPAPPSSRGGVSDWRDWLRGN